jgi:hypothetical protein
MLTIKGAYQGANVDIPYIPIIGKENIDAYVIHRGVTIVNDIY